jgi:glutathione peroxidase
MQPLSCSRPQEPHVSIYDVDIDNLDGSPADLRDYADKVTLIVNVASQCGLTPQYEGLVRLHEQYGERGFRVLGVPCNQFGGQEPGDAEEIATFCSTTYGVAFPLLEKIEVNGENRHPLYQQLTDVADAEGNAGDIQWNFEKFLVAPGGEIVGRFRPLVQPDDEALVKAIESQLPHGDVE